MLVNENERLKNEIKRYNAIKITLQELFVDTKKMKYLTGFPDFPTFEIIYKELEPFLPFTGNNKLSKFDVFLIVFMKLRLDLPFAYLSYQYKVTVKTLSTMFHEAIIVIYKKLNCFVFWPDKEAEIENTPQMFTNLLGKNRIIIIDCFEVYCERPGKYKYKI